MTCEYINSVCDVLWHHHLLERSKRFCRSPSQFSKIRVEWVDWKGSRDDGQDSGKQACGQTTVVQLWFANTIMQSRSRSQPCGPALIGFSFLKFRCVDAHPHRTGGDKLSLPGSRVDLLLYLICFWGSLYFYLCCYPTNDRNLFNGMLHPTRRVSTN